MPRIARRQPIPAHLTRGGVIVPNISPFQAVVGSANGGIGIASPQSMGTVGGIGAPVGSLLVATFTYKNASFSSVSVSDSQGNNWRTVYSVVEPPGAAIAYCVVTKALASSDTISWNHSGSVGQGDFSMWAGRWGLAPPRAIIQPHPNIDTQSQLFVIGTSKTITEVQTGDLLLGISVSTSNGGLTNTGFPGGQLVTNQTNGQSCQQFAYKIAGGESSDTYAVSGGSSALTGVVSLRATMPQQKLAVPQGVMRAGAR